MALTLSSSLLLFVFLFITTPFHSIAFTSSQYSTETDLHENPDLYSDSKASNVGGGGGGGGVTDDSTKLWCVAKNNADDASLQASLDWACGQGGTDCGPIQQGGPCYNPDDFQSTASYAFNDYFQRNGMTEESCNFANTAALTSLDPSHGNCKFPTRARVVVNGGFTAGSATGRVGPSGVSDDTSDGGSQSRRRRRLLWWVQASLITVGLIFA